MAVAKRHRHKYHRIDIGMGTPVWKCALPDCSHYMPKHMEGLLNGKNSTCWECGADINLNPSNMEEDKPKCDNCRLGITPENVAIAEEAPLSPALAAFLNGKSN
jgi:hypothetical protein